MKILLIISIFINIVCLPPFLVLLFLVFKLRKTGKLDIINQAIKNKFLGQTEPKQTQQEQEGEILTDDFLNFLQQNNNAKN